MKENCRIDVQKNKIFLIKESAHLFACFCMKSSRKYYLTTKMKSENKNKRCVKNEEIEKYSVMV